jgi:hypothetical protein
MSRVKHQQFSKLVQDISHVEKASTSCLPQYWGSELAAAVAAGSVLP